MELEINNLWFRCGAGFSIDSQNLQNASGMIRRDDGAIRVSFCLPNTLIINLHTVTYRYKSCYFSSFRKTIIEAQVLIEHFTEAAWRCIYTCSFFTQATTKDRSVEPRPNDTI